MDGETRKHGCSGSEKGSVVVSNLVSPLPPVKMGNLSFGDSKNVRGNVNALEAARNRHSNFRCKKMGAAFFSNAHRGCNSSLYFVTFRTMTLVFGVVPVTLVVVTLIL